MSFFSKLFGGKSGKQKASSTSEAIQKLREVEEMLLKKKDYLEKKVEDEIDIIKKNGTQNKKVSLPALKRKKKLDAQLEQIEGTLLTIDTQKVALENASTNSEVLRVMDFATQALKQANDNITIDKVEDIVEEMKEQQDIANEIQQLISGPMGIGEDVDEDLLLAELEEMDQKQLDEQLLNTDVIKVPELPEVPDDELKEKATKSKKSKSKADEDEEDMKELAQWASN